MIFACSKSSADFMFNIPTRYQLNWGNFSLYLGFRKKTGPMYMGHYHIFFYSKANAPYFPGVGGMGVSIDRCVTLAPLTGFHASKRQDITRVFGLKILLLNVPDCRFISNQPFQL